MDAFFNLFLWVFFGWFSSDAAKLIDSSVSKSSRALPKAPSSQPCPGSRPLVELVAEQGCGTMEKAMVVLSSLARIAEGRQAIVEENGIPVLVEAIEGGSGKGKQFAVLTLLQLCADGVRNRGLLVREGGIPPLVALSQTGTARAKLKAETLLRYLRESRQDAAS